MNAIRAVTISIRENQTEEGKRQKIHVKFSGCNARLLIP
jgi:hypothetical protein